MMKNDRMRTGLARLLLTVMLTAMGLAVVHTHEPVADVERECVQCQHHQPHGGHLQTAVGGDHDCVVCQLLSLVFLPVFVASACLVASRRHTAVVDGKSRVCCVTVGTRLGRAPPRLS